MARRNKPHDPAAATRAALERKDREAEKTRIEAMGGTVKVDPAGRIVSAYRSNVFNLLLQRRAITPNHHDAAHRLSTEWAAWKGLDGKPESFGEVVDGGGGCAELVTDRMIRAGREVKATLSQVEPVSRLLLERLVGDAVERDRPGVWRVQVEQAIGETAKDRQMLAVVAALESLRAVYEQPRRQAA